MASRESVRRSERVKTGLAQRSAAGKPVCRQPGAADRGRRKRSGYVAAWEPGGANRTLVELVDKATTAQNPDLPIGDFISAASTFLGVLVPDQPEGLG
jgi:hypothetical protein